MGIYITYLQSHVQYKSCHSSSVFFRFAQNVLLQTQLVFGDSPASACGCYFHVKARFPSQDMVDGPGSRALRCAGLWVGAAGGEGGHVSQSGRSAGGFNRGQTVHDAGETLQAGGSGCFTVQTLWKGEGRFGISQWQCIKYCLYTGYKVITISKIDFFYTYVLSFLIEFCFYTATVGFTEAKTSQFKCHWVIRFSKRYSSNNACHIHLRLMFLSKGLTVLCIWIAVVVVCIQLLPHGAVAVSLEGNAK